MQPTDVLAPPVHGGIILDLYHRNPLTLFTACGTCLARSRGTPKKKKASDGGTKRTQSTLHGLHEQMKSKHEAFVCYFISLRREIFSTS